MFRISSPWFVIGVLSVLSFGSFAQGSDAKKLYEEGQQASTAGDYLTAAQKFQTCSEALEKSDPVKAQAVYATAGGMFLLAGKPDKALAVLETSLQLTKAAPNETLFVLKKNLVNACQQLGQDGRAANFAEEALSLGVKSKPEEAANLEAQAADSFLRIEAYNKAIAHAGTALKYFATENPERAGLLLVVLGSAKLKLGDFDGADKCLADAWALREKHQNMQNQAEILSNQGLLALYRGNYELALDLFGKARNVEEGATLNENLGADLNNEGLAWRSINNYENAITSFDAAMSRAREVKNSKDEAIALSNRALVRRLKGQFAEAQADYDAALKAFEAAGYREGIAISHLGLAKLISASTKDYKSAWNHAEKALAIYKEIQNTTGVVDATNILAFLIKEGNQADSATRDLVIEEDGPVYLGLETKVAMQKIRQLLELSLTLAEAQQNLENIWECHQGLGYAAWKSGNLDDAMEQYKKAISTVTSIRRRPSDAALAGNYLKDKQDLFSEAISVVSGLNAQKNSTELTNLQLSWSDTMVNEIMKSAVGRASLQFENKQKQDHKNTLDAFQARREKMEQQLCKGAGDDAGKDQPPAADGTRKIHEQDHKSLELAIKSLDGEFEKKLGEWSIQYPEDRDIYSAATKIDVPAIQARLAPDQALLHCFPLGDGKNVILTAISKKSVMSVQSRIPGAEDRTIGSFVVQEFSNKAIEQQARNLNAKTPAEWADSIAYICGLLYDAYMFLYAPAGKVLDDPDVKEILVVPYRDLAYLPFAALKRTPDPKAQDYVVKDKAISYTRLKYLSRPSDKAHGASAQGFFGVANPKHTYLIFKNLPNAEEEINKVTSSIATHGSTAATTSVGIDATETAVRTALAAHPSVLYFATHGYPYSDYYSQFIVNVNKSNGKQFETMREFQQSSQIGAMGLLGGYLLLAYADNRKPDGDQKRDGMLSIKDIMELDADGLDLVVLSACNSSVEFASKVDKETRVVLAKSRERLRDQGWEPGIDQVAFSDAFLRKGASGVLGTLWFVDDKSTEAVVSTYFEGREKEGDTRSLQKAMLDYMDVTRAPEALYQLHPFFWAAYAYTSR